MKKKLAVNTITAVGLQVATVICGFILPRLILRAFGSEVNGLVASIGQFLSAISLLEMGLGVVVPSALYRPLAEQDKDQVSRVMVSATRFFRRLAYAFLAYVAVLVFVYPRLADSRFDFGYTAALLAAMCISSFAQYYFGIANSLLLLADQRAYVNNAVQIVTLLTNTAISAVMIRMGASIHAVKLVASLIYLVRPVVLSCYIRRHYDLDRSITYDREPIGQKWNGVVQHVAFTVLTGTDTIVLTILSTLQNVSVYSVYYMVVHSVDAIFSVASKSGYMSVLGDLWAKRDLDRLRELFGMSVWAVHSAVIFVFGCTAVLIVPFVLVYTAGVTDVEYNVPLFALLLTLAYGFHAIKLPHSLMVLSAGHYKQTQNSYIIAVLLNIILSVSCVTRYGLVGVAIGTLASMVYQTIWMAWYNAKELAKIPFRVFVKQLGVDGAVFAVAYLLTFNMRMQTVSFLSWLLLAVKVALVWGAVVLGVNLLVYKENIRKLIALVLR